MTTHSLNHVKSLQKELTDLTNYKKASKLYQQQVTFSLIGSIYLSKTKTIQQKQVLKLPKYRFN